MDNGDLLTSVKGRLRKPSAKALAAAEAVTSTSSGVFQISTAPVAVSAGSVNRRSILSLQFAVAETVVNDEELPFEEGIDARPEGITIETVALSDWRSKGFHKRVSPAAQVKRISSPVALPIPQGEAVDTTGSEGGGSEDVGVTPKNLDAQSDDSSSATGVVKQEQQPAEVKRKRGRPFKGQEKPIEERLMIETSKIRRLIDDVMRKGGESEFFIRLRNVAAELDSVLAIMPPPTNSSTTFLHNNEDEE